MLRVFLNSPILRVANRVVAFPHNQGRRIGFLKKVRVLLLFFFFFCSVPKILSLIVVPVSYASLFLVCK